LEKRGIARGEEGIDHYTIYKREIKETVVIVEAYQIATYV